jgi:hypothetical protein
LPTVRAFRKALENRGFLLWLQGSVASHFGMVTSRADIYK